MTKYKLTRRDRWDAVIGAAMYIGDMIQVGELDAARSGLVVLVAFAADMSDQDLPLSQGNIQHAKEVMLNLFAKYSSPDYDGLNLTYLLDQETPDHD